MIQSNDKYTFDYYDKVTNMKLIAFYLPQFHTIPENDAWWGKGFTEWVNVRKAKPLYDGHYQPRMPLNGNYYNLLNTDIMKWQVGLAKKYGIYGFCFYHYWFDGKMLLEKPVELFLANKDLELPFCLCWANENWTNGWAAKSPKILIGQKEGNEEKWREHFDYFLPYFKDDRYIRQDDKPLLVIYKPDLFPNIKKMLMYWNELAIESGFRGLTFASQLMPEDIKNSCFDYHIEYQPTSEYIEMTKTRNGVLKAVKHTIKHIAENYMHIDLEGFKAGNLSIFDYDDIWKKILNKEVLSPKMIPGAFVDWDNTARKQERGYVIEGAEPKKFKKFLKAQITNAKNKYKKDMIFLFAWNEWAESGYLEPDEKFGYGYLEAVKDALIELDEFPW